LSAIVGAQNITPHSLAYERDEFSDDEKIDIKKSSMPKIGRAHV
jgi:hypothetical protein